MLNPNYFYGKSDKMIAMYEELEDWILNDIAMRLMKSAKLGGTTDRELFKLEQMGMQQEEIIKRINALTGKSEKEIRKQLQDSVLTSFSADKKVLERIEEEIIEPTKNNAIKDVLNAEYMKTLGEINNLTRTTMMQSQQDLVNLMNKAEIRVSTGTQSYSQAICDVLDEYAKTGMVINYPTGTSRTLESAVRCAMVTSMNQTAGQVTNKYIVEHNVEYVLISAHMGARHDKKHPEGLQSHDWWQGKVFKIDGSDEKYPNLLESTGYKIDSTTGLGTVVNPLGLHGYNCRHSHQPWSIDLRNPYENPDGTQKIDAEESQEMYEIQQQQRYMERGIRRTKREINMKNAEINGMSDETMRSELKAQLEKKNARLDEQLSAYRKYCKDNGLSTQNDRLHVANGELGTYGVQNNVQYNK